MKRVPILVTLMAAASIVAAVPGSVPAQQSSPTAEQKRPGGGQWQGRRGAPDGVGGDASKGQWQGRRGGGAPPEGTRRAGKPPGGGPPGRGGRGRRGGRPTFVTLDPVVRGPVVETVPIYGRLVSRQMGVVAARVRGAVAEIRSRVGDRVKAGDPLAVLLSDTLRAERKLKAAELTEYQARVKSAQAQLALSRQELKRLQRLRRSAAFSQARYEDKRQDVARSRSVLAEARAKVEQARAELQMADISLNNSVIRAPFAGVVSQRHTDLGAYLNVGDRVVTLINDRALEVEAEVPSARLKGLKKGTAIRVEFEDKTPFEVSVRAVVPMENPLARTRTVRFSTDLGTNGSRVAVNQSVRLLIPVGAPRTVISVHKDAVLQRGGRTVVYVLTDGKATLRPVRLGEAVGGRFEVLDGLKPGDKVVIRGNERLRPGQKVRVRRGGPA